MINTVPAHLMESTGITKDESGTITIVGPGIETHRILSLRGALRLETRGMRLRRNFSAYMLVKREFGFKGSKKNVLAQLDAWTEKHLPFTATTLEAHKKRLLS